MTDLRKPSFDLLYELIEEANPGFTAKFPKGTLKFGTPVASSLGGGITNTRIPVRSITGGTAIGTGYLFYRRIELGKLFRGMSLSVTVYRPTNALTKEDYLAALNAKYGVNWQPSDFTNGTHTGPGQAATLTPASGCPTYVGTVPFTWIMGKRALDDLLSADKRTLKGRTFPQGISSYDEFLTWINSEYPTLRSTTNETLTAANGGPFGFRADCADSTIPAYGDPIGGWVGSTSGVSNLVRMLMGSKEIADDNFANRRRIGISYSATVQKSSLPSATRNGYTSQERPYVSDTTSYGANQIVAVYYWDEINRRPMRWQNPNLAGTKAIPFKARQPLADERPRADLIGYAGDYSKWASKLSGTISWQEVADAMKEVTGLPFSMDDYKVPFGLGNIPGGNFPRYTLPTASVPEANSAKFNRVVLVTAPDSGCWWTGRFFLHYNI